MSPTMDPIPSSTAASVGYRWSQDHSRCSQIASSNKTKTSLRCKNLDRRRFQPWTPLFAHRHKAQKNWSRVLCTSRYGCSTAALGFFIHCCSFLVWPQLWPFVHLGPMHFSRGINLSEVENFKSLTSSSFLFFQISSTART